MIKECEICKSTFESSAGNKKCCSKQCLKQKGILKTKASYALKKQESRQDAICKNCERTFNYHFRPERGPRIFCGRSCASKYYLKLGKFEEWRTRVNPKQGIERKCSNPPCDNKIYVTQRFIKNNKARVCSFECEKAYFSQLFMGEHNPMFGKTMTTEQKAKQKETLSKNHPGVSNAFMLAKSRIKTKPQIFLFETVSNLRPDLEFEIEKLVSPPGNRELFGDIVSFKNKLVIEFNGDYWHCNPEKYEANFFHHVKKLTASEIWSLDAKRQETIESYGYKMLTIWESELKSKSWKEKLDRWLEENGKEKNLDAIRPSVNNYSSADVKLGELLESRGIVTTA